MTFADDLAAYRAAADRGREQQWGVVSSDLTTGGIKVILDGDLTTETPIALSLATVAVGDYVLCQWRGQQLILLGSTSTDTGLQRYPLASYATGWSDLGNSIYAPCETTIRPDGQVTIEGVVKYGQTFTAAANTEYQVGNVNALAGVGSRGYIWPVHTSVGGNASMRIRGNTLYIVWLAGASLTSATTVSIGGGTWYTS